MSQVLAGESAPIFTVNCAAPIRKDVALIRLTSPASAFVADFVGAVVLAVQVPPELIVDES